MTKAYVTEYGDATGGGNVQVAQGPALRTQIVDYSAGVAATALPFTDNTKIVRVHVDSICCVAEGVTPVASTATSKRMAADNTEYWGVRPGDKLSFITTT